MKGELLTEHIVRLVDDEDFGKKGAENGVQGSHFRHPIYRHLALGCRIAPY